MLITGSKLSSLSQASILNGDLSDQLQTAGMFSKFIEVWITLTLKFKLGTSPKSHLRSDKALVKLQ